MTITSVEPKTVGVTPIEWVRRRSRVTAATAKTLTELAFATRIRFLADRGDALETVDRKVAR